MEWNGDCHAGSNANGEGADLFMDVGEESVRGPAAQLFDGVSVIAMKF